MATRGDVMVKRCQSKSTCEDYEGVRQFDWQGDEVEHKCRNYSVSSDACLKLGR